jgi:hypothetical protein
VGNVSCRDRSTEADRLTRGNKRVWHANQDSRNRVLCEMLTALGLVELGIVAWHVESLQGKPVFLLTCSAIGVGAPLVRKGRK